MPNLSLLDEVPHCARHIFNGYVRIYAMLIKQIDGVDLESFQRAVDALFDVFRVAVQPDWMRIFVGVDLESKFGCDHDLVAHRCQSLANELLIQEWAVDLSGVEEVDTAFHCCPNEGDHL